ncbi:ABC transporter substrate-binding protein [Robertmurraya yapensis]|uniref:ABC transporter substrate-binding protein n=1 Tax=Bacillus yapensis TaxID=2492960 RepID=A0A3S0JY28_9BACI|nr:ABC transporter substrate-binding protein [Bacillus yapensis]RTR31455.1 ABC transporter substrate-binding protein [Bacillus yapensis]TKS95679.1 ABC transporter substrate-binding protein [Bacillus yapensis]
MLKKFKAVAAVGMMGALILSGCGAEESNGGSSGSGDSEKTYKVGVTQIVEHPSLDLATAGFKKALEESGLKVEFDEQNAQNDLNNAQTIATNFVGDKVDLIFANATPSAQSALNATTEIPILFTSVTDPIGAGLIESFEKPGGNVTGTSDMYPDAIPNTVDFIVEDFGAKSIGTIYNTGEQNSNVQVEEIKKALEGKDVELVESSVATTADVKQAAESLIGKVDVIYIITDNTVVSALDSVIQVSNENDIPLFVGETDSVAKGAFAAFGISYEAIGYETGKMAVEILKGEKTPADIPAQYPTEVKLVINKKAAEEMNIELKEEWNDIAEFLE